jgi:hypothetical protein
VKPDVSIRKEKKWQGYRENAQRQKSSRTRLQDKIEQERSKERSTDKPAAWLACRIQVWSHSASYYRKRLDGDSPKREAEELEENSIFVQPYAFLIPFSQSQDEVA